MGIPRALMIYKFFPMAYQYFKTLGFNVLLSPETDDKIIALGQEMAAEETCYPVKLLHGHMEWLARKKVDYILSRVSIRSGMRLPALRTITAVSICRQRRGLSQVCWGFRNAAWS